eukprot:scaffold365_cov155-Alexandrium_tamarense.AAC.4
MPRPYMKLHISEKDPSLTHQFRHPSPGSQPPVELRATDPLFGNSADDPYNVAYYKRDTGRRLTSDPAAMHRDIEQIKLELLPQDDPRVKEAMEEFEKGPGSSPGNKGVFATGKSDYDPSGLRATMSTNWEATEKSLDENMPDHRTLRLLERRGGEGFVSCSGNVMSLIPRFFPRKTSTHQPHHPRHKQLPTPTWMSKQDEIVAWYEERDLPVAIGGTGFGTVPTHARIARWGLKKDEENNRHLVPGGTCPKTYW